MTLNELARSTHLLYLQHGWWDRPRARYNFLTDEQILLLRVSKLLLMHSEISEAAEELRLGLGRMDSHLPDFPAFDVEIVDLLIRLLDIAGEMNIDIDGIKAVKDAYNLIRPDHDRDRRWLEGGKRF